MNANIDHWKQEPKGYLALVLHAHLPYIRHHDRDDVMEERWFYEAMTETYLPLIEAFDRLVNDGVHFRITMSLTPTLLSLMSDPLMQERYEKHLNKLIDLADGEILRLRRNYTYLPLAHMYAVRFRELRAVFHACGRNVISRFRQFQELGVLEIVTSGATHGFLPLMKHEEAIRAQITTAVTDYERHFGRPPRGIWLPECAYAPGIDRILKSCGIEYFFTDTTALQHASPRANREVYAPLLTPYGVSAFARDPESSQQVWSSQTGYPGDFNYREYYRDIGWDLGWNDLKEWEHIRPHVLPTFERVNTGIKYHRITGRDTQQREPYNPEWAAERAGQHADNFLFNRQKQAEHWNYHLDRKPIVISPYDAELFGHWWYEGPMFIEFLCRKIHFDQDIIQMITPSEYLQEYPVADTGQPAASSWGRNSSYEVWLQGNNDWIYRHLHQAEERMIRLATRHQQLHGTRQLPTARLKRALNQAARELLLAQSSDWAFIMDSKTVVEYACRRTKDHLGCFHTLCGMIEQGKVDEDFLKRLEEKDNCFPAIDYADYVSVFEFAPVPHLGSRADWEALMERTRDRANIFMLAWEYPPKNVGGLSRAVHDLSRTLADLGEAVHVITTSHYGAPFFEEKDGVFIHRVLPAWSGDTDFYHWTFEMNLAMTDYLVRYRESGGRIDLLHAHDWMVYHTAREIKYSFGIPLIATIHATEWGRNHGRLNNPLQQSIHSIEWHLTYEASKVFVCSQYMKRELEQVFRLPEDKLLVYPNGACVDQDLPERLLGDEEIRRAKEAAGVTHAKTVFCIARLVHEKGVQTLLHAAPSILSRVPDALFIIAGSGPMQDELQEMAAHLGDRVRFVGFVDNDWKDTLYAASDVVVVPSHYEPFGIVALEAMRYGKPLIVSDTGGLAEIIDHGEDGYKALPGHVDSLAYHVSELLLSPELGKRMAERALSKLHKQYAWPTIAREIREVYRSLHHVPEPFVYANEPIGFTETENQPENRSAPAYR
ncbi:1,4-alpha-glucan branching protein domain-containing protein [Gorillibacterium sp. sgz5001074]|uniref:1,4-alpha-glucan branching protein domain-containing protein n=1 Tax=Gorillibacterium sp. sgz5001074 TaxID=3446695 RepID=UPI003F671359